MHASPPSLLPATPDAAALNPALEAAVAAVEGSLEGLGEALGARDAEAIDAQATALHRALQAAVDSFMTVARSGHVPPPLRRRLADASGQVAAQRESLARATASLDRAIEVLIPHPEPSVYSASGGGHRSSFGGLIQA